MVHDQMSKEEKHLVLRIVMSFVRGYCHYLYVCMKVPVNELIEYRPWSMNLPALEEFCYDVVYCMQIVIK